MGERSNPNNCASCRHKQNQDGGHCYMFRFEPTEMCAQHTSQIHALQALRMQFGRRVFEAPYLQLAYLLASGQHLVSAERKEAAAAIRDLHAENEALRTAHVQNPAAIEQVAGDVSKNGVELNMSTQQPVAQQGAADGFFLLLPQRPKPEAPAGTAGLGWDAYSGAQMLAFGRDCSDAAIAALRTQQPAPATQQAGDVVAYLDVGASGYLDLGAALSEDALQQLPKGRHALVIAGTYGIDGYVAAPQPSPTTKPAPQQEAQQSLTPETGNSVSAKGAAITPESGKPPAEQQATKETSGGFHVWRDISTAPKDGSRFVATGHNYGLYSEVRHTCVAQWFRGCWMEASDWNETSELKYLTHWMPLPSPPDDVAAPAEQQAAPKAAPGESEDSDGFGSAEHWKEKAQYWAGVAHRLRGEALRGEPVDGIVQPTPIAEQQAAPKAAPVEQDDHQILAITTAYEQGVGKGHQAYNSGKEIANPYSPAYRCDLAWQYGYKEGKEQAQREAKAAPQQEAQEPVAYVHVPHSTVEGKVRPVVSFEKYQQDYADGIYSTRIPLYAAPQPAPAPLSEMPYEKRKAIQEGEQISASDAWFHARHNMLDTLDRRNVFRAGFDRGWNAALDAQGGKDA